MQNPQQHSVKCANCINYKWKQPLDDSTIRRCSNCQLLNYCSKECQIEHWKKTHKYHCKFLAGIKTQSNIEHNPALCQYCKKEANITEKRREIREDNYLGCPWNMNDKINDKKITLLGKLVSSPFQLGEITGNFQSLIEHTLVTLLRLQNKMRTCYGYLNKESVKTILEMREVLRTTYCFVETQNSKNLHIYYQQNIKLSCLLYKLCRHDLEQIHSEFGSKKINDKLKLQDTYQLMIGFLQFHFSTNDISGKIPENCFQITYTYIEQVWKKSISMLESEVWKYEDLVKALYVEISQPKCYHCFKSISTLSHAFWLDKIEASLNRILSTAYVIVAAPLNSLIFVCGDIDCVKNVYKRISFYVENLSCSPSRCDTCFRHTHKMHRCSKCLTKWYCGQACLNRDWAIHKDLCFKVTRKQKMDKNQRLIDHDAFNEFLTALSNTKLP